MGLDMFLSRVKREEVGYWRKANAIHAWFERKLAEDEGLENCREYAVSKEDLIELRDICKTVLGKCKITVGQVKNGDRLDPETNRWIPTYQEGKVISNPEIAEELLPTQSGFFFGSTNYDQWYLDDLEETVEIIDKVLETTDFENEHIVYSAWW